MQKKEKMNKKMHIGLLVSDVLRAAEIEQSVAS